MADRKSFLRNLLPQWPVPMALDLASREQQDTAIHRAAADWLAATLSADAPEPDSRLLHGHADNTQSRQALYLQVPAAQSATGTAHCGVGWVDEFHDFDLGAGDSATLASHRAKRVRQGLRVLEPLAFVHPPRIIGMGWRDGAALHLAIPCELRTWIAGYLVLRLTVLHRGAPRIQKVPILAWPDNEIFSFWIAPFGRSQQLPSRVPVLADLVIERAPDTPIVSNTAAALVDVSELGPLTGG